MNINQLIAELTRQIGYAPSKYQIGILEWVLNGEGNGACNAVAGSGKSSSLRIVALALQLLGYKPSEVRVIVFGKENSKDLINKFGAAWKDSISTLHSCGFRILQQEVGRFQPSERVKSQKYRYIAQDMGYVPSKGRDGELTRSKAIEKPEDLYKAIDLVRLTLSPGKSEDIEQLATHHNIEGILKPAAVAGAVEEILKVGEHQAIQHIIDYTDQIWLPVKWQLHEKSWFKPFRFVLTDECQDLNAAQLELAISLAGSRGRMLFCGDPRQAIMGFAGADNRSYQKIIERTTATELPLSICYRCPRSHIDLVRAEFPHIPIEARDNAPSGTITAVTESELDQHLKVGDMILCRKTAPLVIRCIKLIAKGIKATVKGRDIGEQIKRDLEDIGRLPGFTYPEFPNFVRQYKSLKVQRYLGLDNEEQLIEQLNDKLEALTAIYKARVKATSIAQLADYIDSLFSDETSPITLSTCHRAKGLEGDRIFILKPDDLPFTWRNQLEWQKEQEDNLLYVALTRSKSELFVVGTPGWLPQPQEEEPEPGQEPLPLEPEAKKSLLPDDWGGLEAEFVNILSGRDGYDDYSEDEEPSERELYEEMERVIEEDLLPELAEILNGDPELETVNISSEAAEVNIEYVLGQEQHTSSWAKFYVKGLEKWAVKEDFEENFSDKHHAYQGYTCLDIPGGTIFTIFEQSGDKRGTQNFNFYICETNTNALDIAASSSRGRCQGNFKIVCAGEGKTKAPRLMDWWIGFVGDNEASKRSNEEKVAFALHCSAHIDKRGIKALPPFAPTTESTDNGTAPVVEADTVKDLQSVVETSETRQKQWLNLRLISLDAGTQSRKTTSTSTIEDYAEQMQDRRWDWEREPLPIIFSDGELFWPGDGHHRIMAAGAAGIEQIFVEVRPGILRDALFYSTSANKYHGLPRTNADKRNQVELLLADPEWQLLSDRAIAEHCGVSAPFVGKIRAELALIGTVNISTERIDKSGRKIQTANIGTKPKPQPTPTSHPEQELAATNGTVRSPKQSSTTEVQTGSKTTLLPLPSSSEVERAIATGKASPEQTQTAVHAERENLKAVVEQQITLLSHKFGAKSTAEIALELCSLEEIREIYADLSLNLAALDGEE